jgi:hypothetical protein
LCGSLAEQLNEQVPEQRQVVVIAEDAATAPSCDLPEEALYGLYTDIPDAVI